MKTGLSKEIKIIKVDKVHRLGSVVSLALLVLGGTLFLMKDEAIKMKNQLNQSSGNMHLDSVAKCLCIFGFILTIVLDIRLYYRNTKS